MSLNSRKKGRRFAPQNEAIATQHFLPARERDARDAKGTQRRGGRSGRRDVTPKKH